MADLRQVLQVLQPRLRRHRPLTRAGEQLLFDLAGLLSGLRSLIMLDTAPGATPAMLQQVLQPVAALLPGFSGGILHLDGCCYLANRKQLQHRLTTLATSTTDWPLIITFSSGHAAIMALEECLELQRQVGTLADAMQTLLAPAMSEEQSAEQGTNQLQSVGSPGFSRIIDLSKIPGLPVMPTLNGLLLGYPVVYWVTGLDEAAAASRVLSASVLQLFCVKAVCSCVGPTNQALMSFTVPAELCDAGVEKAVNGLRRKVQESAANCSLSDGCAALPAGTWGEVVLAVEGVGPRPISL